MEGLLPDLLAGAGIRAPVPVQAGQMLVILVLVAARPLGFIAMMPLFGRFHLTVGFLRGAVLASMIMPILPGAIVQVGATPDLVTPAGLPALIGRELIIGVVLGLLTGIPFWAAMAAGEFVDAQRGASMALLFDPGAGTEESLTGTLLLLVCVMVLAVTGTLIPALFGPLYESYNVIPLLEKLPPLDPAQGALALGLLGTLLRAGIILALPMIVPMLLIEMGLVVATKYIPQLNAMFLAMSIKQALFVILMVAYAALLARYAMGMLDDAALSAGALRPFLDALR